ncbi:MAG: DUF3658 domain-containing protein [Sedimentibacter sp.]|uniref:DUF3658 domain-containing protein n=1 Tax=Sedimentibacter sp. TaxID=1960295 RepID=UPI0031584ED8
MIEVMFGESEGGAMKMAKNYQKPDIDNMAIGWFGEKPSREELDKMFDGEAVGGNSSEVICIPFMLDIGDINVPVENEHRKNIIMDMYTINGIDDKNTLKSLEKTWNKYLSEVERLKNFAEHGENIRLWYSDAPYSACGFHYACSLLKDYSCRVFMVKLPDHVKTSDNEIQFYSSWGEVEAGKFYKFLPLAKELSECELSSFSSAWGELKGEDSSLRAVVSGKVIGVPEDFYDHLIKKEIPEGEFVMARLIGKVLGKYQLGVGDWWYAKRINYMIEQGDLEIVQKNKEIYSQVLRRP